MTSDSRHRPTHVPLLAVLFLAACAADGPFQRGRGETLFLDETAPSRARTSNVPKSGRTEDLAKQFDLVDVRKVIPDISIDLRYGTAQNVAKRSLYPGSMPCLLRRETAEKLRAAQALLRSQGYGIRVWDGYRPPEVQEALYQAGAATHMFISPESAGWSRHCGGIAVDVTLMDAAGREQRMPTAFDAGLANASATYRGGDPVIARNVRLLQQAMQQAGFSTAAAEWWHFDDADFAQNPQPVIYGWQLRIPVTSPKTP
ncbi:M15 family metallopeptidase [Prosthecobacter sp.]|uniref:M15 family metallopeptidase n=1 Tax=Prosthecobacter sp. TaxID=1965333 RepID=UPI001DE5C878|nr:M15 family metallopeptidase [Prosthecobacter sp.]MCB1278700.1 M15 family metallopeptidase [Prosthecobacter sp.]